MNEQSSESETQEATDDLFVDISSENQEGSRQGQYELVPYEWNNNEDIEIQQQTEDVEEHESEIEIQQTEFDTSMTNLHTYLGEIDDVQHTGTQIRRLQDNSTIYVPLLVLEGVVMVPGMSLPLQISGVEGLIITKVLNCRGPLNGWLAVSIFQRKWFSSQKIGCLTKIHKTREENGTIVSCIAVGKHRIRIHASDQEQFDYMAVECEVLEDVLPSKIPKEVQENTSYLSLNVAKLHDCYTISDKILKNIRLSMPQVRQFQGDPLRLSFWCIQNLPLSNMFRQSLLQMELSQRLRRILKFYEKVKVPIIICQFCATRLGDGNDVISMSDTGPGGCFVNPSGYVHDVITLQKASNVELWGEPSTEQSWFPGYAWTIIMCVRCHLHLGWRFTATQSSLVPSIFYGFRHGMIAQSTLEQFQED